MIRVQTSSRLHFGLLSLPAADSEVVRQFGGVGLMVEAPGVHLTAAPAPAWSAEGPLAERALAFARRLAQTLNTLPPQHLIIEPCAPEHSGLGTGTQLALAVARALAVAGGQQDLEVVELARRVGRGLRSSLGIHGFAQGGFLVEAGKRSAAAIAPLVARVDFPEPWRILMVLPPGTRGRYGREEQQAFQVLANERGPAGNIDALCRLVLLGMLPALVEGTLDAFGEALYEFNVRVGEAFAPVQGGTYAGPAVSDLVTYVRQQGVRGVGQSSWGPLVFAIVADEERASDLAARLRTRFSLGMEQVICTWAANHGATWNAE